MAISHWGVSFLDQVTAAQTRADATGSAVAMRPIVATRSPTVGREHPLPDLTRDLCGPRSTDGSRP
jgi:hypothetical protein